MKTLFITLSLVALALMTVAQSPQAFNYQTVIRDGDGEPIQNQAVALRMSIHDILPDDTILYRETHSATTNEFGLIVLQIGTGSADMGDFSAIDWSTNAKYLEIEIDPEGGSNFTSLGTSQLVSVPYALHAETVTHVDDADADSTNELQILEIDGFELSISNGNAVPLPSGMPSGEVGQTISHNGNSWAASSNLFNDGTNVGIGTTAPASKLEVAGAVRANKFVDAQNTSFYLDPSDEQTSGVLNGHLGIGGAPAWFQPLISLPGWGPNLHINTGQDTAHLWIGGHLTQSGAEVGHLSFIGDWNNPTLFGDKSSKYASITGEIISSGGQNFYPSGALIFSTATGAANTFPQIDEPFEEHMRITHEGFVGIGTQNPNEKLTIEGVLSMKEAISPTTNAGYGKLFVKSSDNNLYFLNDAGDEMNLSGSGLANNYWNINGNAGTNPGTNFLGTTDNNALQFHVNNMRAMRIEPNSTSPNLIGGFSGNNVNGGIFGASIAGGGTNGNINQVLDNYSVIGGGYNNVAGDMNFDAYAATVGGGSDNNAIHRYTVVDGGFSNTADRQFATIGGGSYNLASHQYATISGGTSNTNKGDGGSIGGGQGNTIGQYGHSAAIPGGWKNAAYGMFCVAMGNNAKAHHNGSIVMAANSATWVSPADSVVSGGEEQMVFRTDGGMYITNIGGVAPYDPSRLINTSVGAYLSASGVWSAPGFDGNGSALTNLNASNIISGTLNNDRFSALSDLGGGSGTTFLRKDGTWANPPATAYSAGNDLSLSGTTFSLENDIDVNYVRATGAAGLKLFDDDNNGIYIRDGGNVGIGVTDPEYGTLCVHATNSAGLKMTNDGTGSGYNDGFLLSWMSGGNSAVVLWNRENTPIAFATNNSERMRIKENGYVGIGSNDPQYKLHVNGTAYATGAAGALSDGRHKTNVLPISENTLEQIDKLRPVSFDWINPLDDGMQGTQLGFIAQEVEEIFPGMVLTQDNEEKTKALKYNEFIPVLVKAVQELKAENEALKERLDKLEGK